MEANKDARFFCNNCNYITNKKSSYDKHCLSTKHSKGKIASKNFQKNVCDICFKEYMTISGLWKHQKQCKLKIDNGNQKIALSTEVHSENKKISENKKVIDNEVFCKLLQQNIDLVTQNQEFKQMMIELQKQVIDLASKSTTNIVNNNNTTNNNKFNMNIFLNEKCKDALNIMDFVTSLPLNLEDLEETGKQGYVKGLSRILVNGLKGIDISKRPIHCSDLKRETFYIKDNNVWEKEDAEKKRIKNAIKYISLKNAKQITQWTKENEGYRDSHNKKSDVYLKLVYEANGGDDDELNKIIKNISANVTIDKNDPGGAL